MPATKRRECGCMVLIVCTSTFIPLIISWSVSDAKLLVPANRIIVRALYPSSSPCCIRQRIFSILSNPNPKLQTLFLENNSFQDSSPRRKSHSGKPPQ